MSRTIDHILKYTYIIMCFSLLYILILSPFISLVKQLSTVFIPLSILLGSYWSPGELRVTQLSVLTASFQIDNTRVFGCEEFLSFYASILIVREWLYQIFATYNFRFPIYEIAFSLRINTFPNPWGPTIVEPELIDIDTQETGGMITITYRLTYIETNLDSTQQRHLETIQNQKQCIHSNEYSTTNWIHQMWSYCVITKCSFFGGYFFS